MKTCVIILMQLLFSTFLQQSITSKLLPSSNGFTGLPYPAEKGNRIVNMWPKKTVRYAIDDALPNEWHPELLKTLDQFHTKTCLKWQLVSDKEKAIYVNYFKNIDQIYARKNIDKSEKKRQKSTIEQKTKAELGPTADLGFVLIRSFDGYDYGTCGDTEKGKHFYNVAQEVTINLHHNCYKHSFAHEMMHTAGFSHEFDRYDRYKYVTMKHEERYRRYLTTYFSIDREDMIEKLYQMNLTRFDYRSVLMYRSDNYYYVNPAMPESEFAGENSRSNTFSELDILKINRLYECGKERDWLNGFLKGDNSSHIDHQ